MIFCSDICCGFHGQDVKMQLRLESCPSMAGLEITSLWLTDEVVLLAQSVGGLQQALRALQQVVLLRVQWLQFKSIKSLRPQFFPGKVWDNPCRWGERHCPWWREVFFPDKGSVLQSLYCSVVVKHELSLWTKPSVPVGPYSHLWSVSSDRKKMVSTTAGGI